MSTPAARVSLTPDSGGVEGFPERDRMPASGLANTMHPAPTPRTKTAVQFMTNE